MATDERLVTAAAIAFEQGTQYLQDRDVTAACAYFVQAERLGHDPDACSGGRWICHMLEGSFEAAWQESDRISNRALGDPNRFWSGRSLAGKRVLVRCLHGLGDTIHFVRYLPHLRESARSIVIETQPALKDLLLCSAIADDVITWGDPEPAWDEQIEVVELPRIFRTTLNSVPSDVPYLKTSTTGAHAPNEHGGRTHLKVGLVWAGSPYDPARTIPLRLLQPLLGVPSVQVVSLQGNPDRQEIQDCALPIPDLYHPSGSILIAAQSLQQLDLLITADTMMAHLAGALNVRCWTLLPLEADWRWLLNRTDSPWYPSMRLFRQTERSNWTPVIKAVTTALHQLAASAEPVKLEAHPAE